MKYILIIISLIFSIQLIAQNRDIYDSTEYMGNEGKAFKKFLYDTTIKKPRVGDLMGGGIVVYVNIRENKFLNNIPYQFTVFGYIMALNDIDSVTWDTTAAKKYNIGGYSDWRMPHIYDIYKILRSWKFSSFYGLNEIMGDRAAHISPKYAYWCIAPDINENPCPSSFNGSLADDNISNYGLPKININEKHKLRLIRDF